MTTATGAAAVNKTYRAGVTWKLLKSHVITLRFEFSAQGGVFCNSDAFAFFFLDPARFCHKIGGVQFREIERLCNNFFAINGIFSSKRNIESRQRPTSVLLTS